MPDFFMNGLRSTNAPEVQNSPTLSVVKDDTTSGALGPPARNAWLILSSVMLATALTVMFGCTFSKALTFSSIALISLGAVQPCQKVIVVFALGSSLAPPLDPVQADAVRASTTAADAAARRRGWRTADMGLLLRVGTSGGERHGRGLQRVEDVLSGGGQRRVQRPGEHGLLRDGRQLDGRSGDGEVGELAADHADQSLTPCAG